MEEPEESATSKIQNLADVMIHLLSRSASSASVEQVGLIYMYTKLRNGLAWTMQQNLWTGRCVAAQQKMTIDHYWLSEY